MAEERDTGLLRPGATCWRVERARRAAMLPDGAAYFSAMRAAMERARRSILLVGWDFDAEMRLGPAGGAEAEKFHELMRRLLARRPELQVHILIWDMAFAFRIQRRSGPRQAAAALPGGNLHFRLDAGTPFGASHHQKILVVDDAVAFCGGSDFSRNRWDTTRHLPRDPRRRSRENAIYGPRHDVMMAVDGPVAAGLADVVRERWRRATGETLTAENGGTESAGTDEADPWPEDLVPDMRDVAIGIARTEPERDGRPAVREAEALHLAAIAAARRWIYMENQYFTSPVIGAALARRLAEPDGPEVVVVTAARSGGPSDRLTWDHARNSLIHRLQAADRHGRFRAFAAMADGDVPIIVHSKVTVVDDRLLRVGSTNLNNRSMGFDTECDIAVEVGDEAHDEQGRSAVRRMLDRLLTEHLGRGAGELEEALLRTGSLTACVDQLNPATGRRLRAFDVPRPSLLDRVMGRLHLLDPTGPADNLQPWRRLRLGR